MTAVLVSVQGSPKNGASWLALARSAEAAGFDGLYAADHPGAGAAPFVALAAAAAVTDRIRLGTCVANAGVWEPMALAGEVATLDLMSNGRAVLGVGAGHTPSEWTSTGRAYPSPGDRVDRMIELIDATRALLAGETVTAEGAHITLSEARLVEPRPRQDPIPLVVGGGGTRLLRHAAAHAEVVGITGLGRTLADGHDHAVDWTSAGIARVVDIVGSAAAAAGRSPAMEALVQHVEITDDADAAAARLEPHVTGATVGDLLDNPFVWIGTISEIRDRLQAHQDRWGVGRYMVRAPAMADVQRILSADGF